MMVGARAKEIEVIESLYEDLCPVGARGEEQPTSQPNSNDKGLGDSNMFGNEDY